MLPLPRRTSVVCPSRTAAGSLVFKSHSVTLPADPEARRAPSGEERHRTDPPIVPLEGEEFPGTRVPEYQETFIRPKSQASTVWRKGH